jgi:hypothetical protein
MNFLDFFSIPSYFSCTAFVSELFFISKKLCRWVPPVSLLHPRQGPPVGALKPHGRHVRVPVLKAVRAAFGSRPTIRALRSAAQVIVVEPIAAAQS